MHESTTNFAKPQIFIQAGHQVKLSTLILLCREYEESKAPKETLSMGQEHTKQVNLIPPSTQNLKTLGLWVFLTFMC